MKQVKVDEEEVEVSDSSVSADSETDEEILAVDEESEELMDPEGLEDIDPDQKDSGKPSIQTKYQDLNDRYLRLAAEFENFRKRTRKERDDFQKTATADLIQKLLPVLDSLSRGVEFNAQAECLESVKEGLVKVNRLFTEILEKEGLSPIEESNVPMDINLHMAVFQEDRDDVEDHTVLDVFEKGYSLRGKVLRPAKVKVSNKVEEESSEAIDQDSATEGAESKSNE